MLCSLFHLSFPDSIFFFMHVLFPEIRDFYESRRGTTREAQANPSSKSFQAPGLRTDAAEMAGRAVKRANRPANEIFRVYGHLHVLGGDQRCDVASSSTRVFKKLNLTEI